MKYTKVLLTAASVPFLIAAGEPQNPCTLPKPVQIIVTPKTADLIYDTSRTMADLQKQQTDTIDPYGFHGISVTQGFMEGQIEMRPEVTLDYYPLAGGQVACLFYDTITITISITPKITLAKEVDRDSCMRKAVTEHEMKHVMTDRHIVNRYSRLMGEKLNAALAERGFTAGPLRSEDMQRVAGNMHKVVFQILEHEYKKMELERADAQQAVDSRAEYDRVADICPHFKIPEAAGKAAVLRGQ